MEIELFYTAQQEEYNGQKSYVPQIYFIFQNKKIVLCELEHFMFQDNAKLDAENWLEENGLKAIFDNYGKRKFFKTTVLVEILSEDFPAEFDSLEDIHNLISEGDCSGCYEITAVSKLDGKMAAQELQKQGSEPGFFQIDDEGNDI